MVQDRIEIRRALISVFDKSGLDALLKQLDPQTRGIELISSGGTATKITELGYAVTEVGKYTGFPESPGGYVKTLHPKVHGGLLLDPEHVDPKTGKNDHAEYMNSIKIPKEILEVLDMNNPAHRAYAELTKIGPIDLFVGNLYPFQSTVVKDPTNYEAIRENIDIGGPAMIRAAAKGFRRVAVLVNWSDVDLLREFESAEPIQPIGTDMKGRVRLMKRAFEHTRDYEGAIDDFWSKQDPDAVAKYFLVEKK